MMRTIVFDGLKKKTLGKETALEMRREKREREKNTLPLPLRFPSFLLYLKL